MSDYASLMAKYLAEQSARLHAESRLDAETKLRRASEDSLAVVAAERNGFERSLQACEKALDAMRGNSALTLQEETRCRRIAEQHLQMVRAERDSYSSRLGTILAIYERANGGGLDYGSALVQIRAAIDDTKVIAVETADTDIQKSSVVEKQEIKP